MGLVRYKSKRDFRRTREPAGRKGAASRRSRLMFVIQKHAASRLHYDFRLEMDGVLKSWAVPKGIPTSKGDKRLAVEVEDHPLEYGRFEGLIPPGNYGAGTVMVWDGGSYEMLEGQPSAAWQAGKLVFRLQGKKLKGVWTLVRMRPTEASNQKAWLLIKTEDSVREISARADDTSAQSGRTMKQIAAATGKTWESSKKSSSQFKKARLRGSAWKSRRKSQRT